MNRVFVLAILLLGCDHGANIPIDPIDPCMVEGVEECCPECSDCMDEYNQGYSDGQDGVVCPEPETVYLCKHVRWSCDKIAWNCISSATCGRCELVTEWGECEKD